MKVFDVAQLKQENIIHALRIQEPHSLWNIKQASIPHAERKMHPKKVTKTNTTAKSIRHVSRRFHPTGKTINREGDQFPLLSTKVNELRLSSCTICNATAKGSLSISSPTTGIAAISPRKVPELMFWAANDKIMQK